MTSQINKITGDIFPVGCAFDESILHHKENPDSENTSYNTKYGVYQQGCELENVLMSWGHDDYIYLVAKENGTLPSTALFIIRYHSFYLEDFFFLTDDAATG
ncbi:Inositol oxygenase 1 [Abeliophyllum distichum]|uniref:Inositol oxygenase n=1 Tax=Abeliophyllum distichum TaxID=126358 RepID=A0ABD1R945_9LAMI